MKMHLKTSALLVTGSFFALMATPVLAQGASNSAAQQTGGGADNTVQEVVITADKSSVTSIQKTVGAVAAVSGQQALRTGQINMESALQNIPGVSIGTSSNNGGYDMTIRGVGPTIPAFTGGDTGVAYNFDGVFNTATAGSGLGFYDLNRVEVLLGPQGTLYGRNAEGGVMNVITNDPSKTFEGAASAEFGNYNLEHFTGMINAPINDNLSLRVAMASISRAGYYNDGLEDDVEQSARVKLLYTPTDSTRLLIGGEYYHVGGQGPASGPNFGLTAPSAKAAFTITAPSDSHNDQSGSKIWLQLDQDLNFARFTLLPAYQQQSEDQYLGPVSGSGASAYDDIGLPGGTYQRSVEARLASEPSSWIKWVGGVFFYDSGARRESGSATIANGTYVATGATPSVEIVGSKSEGVFGQATVPVTTDLRLLAGVRQSYDQKTAYSSTSGAATISSSFQSFDYKVGLEYDLAPRSMIYGTVSTGYRPGGIAFAPAPYATYVDEHLTAFELGSKNEFFDRALKLNADIFYYDYKNFQVQNLEFVGPPTFYSLFIPNIPSAYNYGAELSIQYRLSSNDSFVMSTTYSQSRIGGTTATDLVGGAKGIEYLGEPLPNAPKWTLTFGPEHVFELPGGATLTALPNIRYTSTALLTVTGPVTAPAGVTTLQAITQPAYWNEDFSLVYVPEKANWTLSAYVRNISNVVVKSTALGGGAFLRDPRVFGAIISAKF